MKALKKTSSVFFAIALALSVLFTAIPIEALAEGASTPVSISSGDLTEIGYHEDFDANFYYVSLETDQTTVELSFIDDDAVDGTMISGLFQTGYIGDTKIVDVSQGFAITKDNLLEEYGEYLNTAGSEIEENSLYGLFIMDGNYESTFLIINLASVDEPTTGFVSDIGTLSGPDENGYTYTEYVYDPTNPDAEYGYVATEAKAELYTLTVPYGTQEIHLTFEEPRLVYAYDADDNYLAPCGAENDGVYENGGRVGQTGATIRRMGDGFPAYLRVQTPYDESYTSSDVLYAIKVEENYVFTASGSGSELTEISFAENAYSYTNYYGNTSTVGLFTIILPEGTTSVDLALSDHVLMYNYGANPATDDDYLAGITADYMTGTKSGTVSVDANNDGNPDYIQIQTPYTDGWNSDLIYAITFEVETSDEPDEPSGEMTEDLADIYKTVGDGLDAIINADVTPEVNSNHDWAQFGLARADRETSDDYVSALVQLINEKNGELHTNPYTYSEYSRAILTLTASGYNPETVASTNILDGLKELDKITAQGVNGAAYALLALDSHSYDSDIRDGLVTYILEQQLADGGWTYSGDVSEVDMTAIAIQALVPYLSDTSVESAVNTALDFLKNAQCSDGSFGVYADDTRGTLESTAQVIVALTSLGQNPETFCYEGEDADSPSVLDGLALYYKDGKFRHVLTGTTNTIATNQGYYALASYHRYLEGKSRLYDMNEMELSDTLSVIRIAGSNRYATAMKTADEYKKNLGVEKLDTIIVAYGENFADALAGSYLASVKNAPIILVSQKQEMTILSYIEDNVVEGGTVYLLGGTGVVSESFETSVKSAGFNPERLAGANRYLTNIAILEEAGVTDETLLVVSGENFPDALSASAVGLPILLVGKNVTDAQSDYLDTIESDTGYLIGGSAVVSDAVETSIAAHLGNDPERIYGTNRYETSLRIAETFFSGESGKAVLAYGENFPDGLAGGPLALQAGCPLILCDSRVKIYNAVADFFETASEKQVYVLGGTSLISDEAAYTIIK